MFEVIVLFFLIILIYSVLVEPRRLIVRKVKISTEKWCSDYPPLKIAVISDPHVGAPFVGLKKLKQVVELANEQKPDVVVLLGDNILGKVFGGCPVPFEDIAKVLSKLEARTGVLAVNGNHECRYGVEKVRKIFEENGVLVLDNEAVTLKCGINKFWVGGLANYTYQHSDVEKTMKQMKGRTPVIMLTHEPAAFKDIPEEVALTLAGHTHGGQIYLPWLFRPPCHKTTPKKWIFGHINENGNHMYVSGGIGTSFLPMRINMLPAVDIIELSSETSPNILNMAFDKKTADVLKRKRFSVPQSIKGKNST